MSRILDFADGFESTAEPLAGSVTATGLKSFASDADFVTDKDAPAESGDIYFNTTLKTVRYYNGSVWLSLIGRNYKGAIAINSLQAAGTVLTLPNAGNYIVGSNSLFVSLGGQLLENGQDYNEVGTLGTLSSTFEMLFALRDGDRIVIRIG